MRHNANRCFLSLFEPKKILIVTIFLFLFLSQTFVCYALDVLKPLGAWKTGGVSFSISINCFDDWSKKPLTEVIIQAQVGGAAEPEQKVKSQDGKYKLKLTSSTISGQTYIRIPSMKSYRTFGRRDEFVVLRISAEGYRDRFFVIPHNKIIIEEDYEVNANMFKK